MKTEVPADANAAESSVASDRRSHLRRNILFSCVELGGGNGGIVLDISESGFALQTIAVLTDDELLNIHFQFAPTYSWIDTKGRIVWRSGSKMVAGVQFIDLPKEAREQIRIWTSFTGEAAFEEEKTQLVDIAQTTSAIAVSELRGKGPIPKPQPEARAVGQSQSLLFKPILPIGSQNMALWKPIRLVWPLIASMLLLLALFPLSHPTTKLVNMQKHPEMTAARKQLEAPSILSASPSSNSPSPSDLARNLSGLVLQVAAMAHEENADALAESLCQSNFPVVVTHTGNSRFYRVVVGPYRDVDSARRVEDQLRQLGLGAFRIPWKAPVQ